MKRICMYVPSADGGHARYTWELMTALSAQARGRIALELVTSEDLDPQFNTGLYPVHPILPKLADRSTFSTKAGWIASRLTHYPRREWQFLKWLKGRPDITAVHFQEWAPWLAGPLFRRIQALGKQVFFTAHNIVPHKYPKFVPKSVMNGWIRKACLQADGLFVLSDRLSAELSRFLGESHPPIQVVSHGVWTVKDSEKAPPLEERLAAKRLLCFGAIRSNKGTDLLLRAMEKLPGYSVTIAGEPYHLEYFRKEIVPLVEQLRTKGVKVDLIDRFIPDEEVGKLFASHSAIVLPYTRGFVAQSGVMFMALAYELPVIASEVGGLRDLFDQFKIGTTFNDATPEALAEAVLKLNSTDQQDVVKQIRLAKRRYSWQDSARLTIAGYELADEKVTQENDCPITTTATR
jgi:glycosyltransferase involved in cell wall biosynthesis